MAKKVLITGAAGLIGRELCKQLKDNFLVIGTDNNFRYPEFVPDCSFVQQDLKEFIASNSNRFDYIFHMAAINGTKYFYEMPNTVIENNVTTDLAIFEFARSNPQCKLIYASSSEVVADTEKFPTAEDNDIVIKDLHNPRWSYRLGKVLSENYLMNSKLNFLIVRFFNVFGKDSGEGHFIKDILDKLAKGDQTLIGADETRSFCRVEDAVDAVMNVFEKVSGQVINIGSDEEISVLEAAKILAAHKGQYVNWQCADGHVGSVKRRKPCLNKLLQYYPEYTPRKFINAVGDL